MADAHNVAPYVIDKSAMKALKPVYAAPSEHAAKDRIDEFTAE